MWVDSWWISLGFWFVSFTTLTSLLTGCAAKVQRTEWRAYCISLVTKWPYVQPSSWKWYPWSCPKWTKRVCPTRRGLEDILWAVSLSMHSLFCCNRKQRFWAAFSCFPPLKSISVIWHSKEGGAKCILGRARRSPYGLMESCLHTHHCHARPPPHPRPPVETPDPDMMITWRVFRCHLIRWGGLYADEAYTCWTLHMWTERQWGLVFSCRLRTQWLSTSCSTRLITTTSGRCTRAQTRTPSSWEASSCSSTTAITTREKPSPSSLRESFSWREL